MSGMYKVSFVKGNITGSSFIATEYNVDLPFILGKDDANLFSVKGEGGDQFGIFILEGTATKKNNNPLSFAINMEKMYIPQNPIMPTAMADTHPLLHLNVQQGLPIAGIRALPQNPNSMSQLQPPQTMRPLFP